jgi:hypothetical protein
MKHNHYKTTLAAALMFASSGFVVSAQTALPLSAILALVEADGARTVYSADSHIRGWEVVSCEGRSRICREDLLDSTGAVRATDTEAVFGLPPVGALPASQIAAVVEAMAIGAITEMEFDDRVWDVEVRASIGSRADFEINPMTGAVGRCEGRACP